MNRTRTLNTILMIGAVMLPIGLYVFGKMFMADASKAAKITQKENQLRTLHGALLNYYAMTGDLPIARNNTVSISMLCDKYKNNIYQSICGQDAKEQYLFNPFFRNYDLLSDDWSLLCSVSDESEIDARLSDKHDIVVSFLFGNGRVATLSVDSDEYAQYVEYMSQTDPDAALYASNLLSDWFNSKVIVISEEI